MEENRSYLPSADRVGVLIASILLTYALTRIVQSPHFTLTVTLPGFYFAYPLTLGTAMTVFAAALAATGMDWLTRDHPSLGKKPNIEHLLLPTLTTFVIGGPLGILPDGALWWLGLTFGALLLVGVFLAEYITIDASAPSYALARAGLTALAFALFLILVTALRFSGARMFLLVPVLFMAAALISLRLLPLYGNDRWDFPRGFGFGRGCEQIAPGFHFFPPFPIKICLGVAGPPYPLFILFSILKT